MYARGMTVREIQGHLLELYGTEVSPDLISTITDLRRAEANKTGEYERISNCNVVHSLRRAELHAPESDHISHAWTQTFDDAVAAAFANREDRRRAAYDNLSPSAHIVVPTPDHFSPLLYALGAASTERIRTIFQEF